MMKRFRVLMLLLFLGIHFVRGIKVDVVKNNNESKSDSNDIENEGGRKESKEELVSFLGRGQTVTVSKGRDAVLRCSVDNLGPYTVGWVRLDTKGILAIGNRVITHNNRVSVTGDFSSTFDLSIAHVRQEDAGPYMCQVNTSPMITQTSHLEVLESPEIVWSSGDQSVLQGRSARLICRASGMPKPSISWRREDGKVIRYKNGQNEIERAMRVEREQLLVPLVTPDDMAAYLCIAHNGIPPARSKRVLLYVQFAPVVEAGSPLINAARGSSIALTCRARAYPRPLIFWRHRGRVLVNASEERDLGDFNYISSLTVTVPLDQRSGDSSKYECVAKNSIGVTAVITRVYVMEPQQRETAAPKFSLLTAATKETFMTSTSTTKIDYRILTTTTTKFGRKELEKKIKENMGRREHKSYENTNKGPKITSNFVSVVIMTTAMAILGV